MLLTKYYSGDQIENNEMDGAGSTYGGQERCIQGFFLEKPEGKSHLEDPGVDGRIILRYIFRKWDGARTGLSWLRIGTVGGHL